MDKMEAHLRQQLSAMMDGELASDEARFLFRRLQHDRDLAGCWERWQVCSVLLRGQGTALLPADFSQRVAHAVALESPGSGIGGTQAFAATGTHSRRWAWWGGGALAASLALLVVVPHPASDPDPATVDAPRIAAATPARTTLPAPSPAAVSKNVPHSPASPPVAAEVTTALAIAEAPRRIAARRSRASSHGSDHASSPAPRTVEAADSGQRVAVAEPLSLPRRSNPFAPHEPLSARPWPRAVLPGANTGAFTASYPVGEASSFYPFEPRGLSLPEAQPAAGDVPR